MNRRPRRPAASYSTRSPPRPWASVWRLELTRSPGSAVNCRSDSMRRSSRKQDAAPTSAERAVQVRPRRSKLRRLLVRQVSLPEVRGLIEREHYTHSTPAAASQAFAVLLDGRLEG